MEITKRIHALKHTFTIRLNAETALERFVYSFLIVGEQGVYVIDSGVKDSLQSIYACLKECGRMPSDIKVLLLTHAHPDHIGSAKQLQEETGCLVYAHQAEKHWIESIEQQYKDRPVPSFMSLVGGPVRVDRCIRDQEVLVLEENSTVRVIHTPGHSPGSVSFLCEEENVLITGDAVVLPGSMPIYDDVIQMIASLRKLKEVSRVEWMLSSWDDPCRGNAEISTKCEEGETFLNAIHQIVRSIPQVKELMPMEVCERVMQELQYPAFTINPLVARSLRSHIGSIGQSIL